MSTSTHTDSLTATTILTAIIVTTAIAIRVYNRSKRGQSLELYTLGLAYFILLSTWILTLVWVRKKDYTTSFYKLAYANDVLFLWTMVFVRVSILLFISRILSTESYYLRVIKMGLIVANMGLGIGGTMAYTLRCGNINDLWKGSCGSSAGYVINGFEVVLDLGCLLLGIGQINKLGILERRKRVERFLMIALGMGAVITTGVRFDYLKDDNDKISATICRQIEATFAIIAACIPSITQSCITSARGRVTAVPPIPSKRSSILQDPQIGHIDLIRDSQLYYNIDIPSFSSPDPRTDTPEPPPISLLPPTARAEKSKSWSHRLSQMNLKYNSQLSRYSLNLSSNNTSKIEVNDEIIDMNMVESPPRSITHVAMLGLEDARPGLAYGSFEYARGYGYGSEVNSLELSTWETGDSGAGRGLTPRPSSNYSGYT